MDGFFIGRKVVAITNHTQGAFKEGDIFTVTNTDISTCCNHLRIQIGIVKRNAFSQCITCGYRVINNTNEWWFNSKSFMPLDEDKGELFIEEFLTEFIEI